ncbi:MAG TPA: TraR/DksA family transcriptional regulator [Candidatus Paceibacterota bacterium]
MIKKKVKEKGVVVNRYSSEKLEKFKKNILFKLEETLKSQDYHLDIMKGNKNGTDDTATNFSDLNDGKSALTKAEAEVFYKRDVALIPLLKNALVRIENKNYGICFETGKFIPEERLMAVPHATRSIEGKDIEKQKKSKRVINQH